MKLIGAAMLCALILVPIAAADVNWTVTSGVKGDNGWYLSTVTIHATTLPSGCPAPIDITFHTTDEAHNFSCGSPPVNPFASIFIDTTPPTVTGASADRPTDKNGWYTHAVNVVFAGSDGAAGSGTSGIASCTKTAYAGPDSGAAAAAGTCRDVAGNVSAAGSFALKYDSTPPTPTAAPSRAADSNDWYSHPFSVSFAGSDATSGLDSCSAAASYSGPDTASAQLTGSCTDQAGNTSSIAFPFHYDGTPPIASATPSRKPDADGWYNHPFSVTFSGTDAGSGMGSCTDTQTYSGPGSTSGQVPGTCVDKAGNSAGASFSFKYDATPPTVSNVSAAIGDGTVALSWRQSADTTSVTVLRAPGRSGAGPTEVYRGKATTFNDKGLRMGVTYRYTIAATDDAGNSDQVGISAAMRALYAPLPGQRVKAGATLAWIPDKSASYYNVQLFRNRKKVLSTWPVAAHFRLPRSWKFEGRRQTLKPGKYTWYVWPGLGTRTKSKYGKLLGGSTFVVR
jgi:hypothetical protein